MRRTRFPDTVQITVEECQAAKATIIVLALGGVVLVILAAELVNQITIGIETGAVVKAGVGGDIPVDRFPHAQAGDGGITVEVDRHPPDHETAAIGGLGGIPDFLNRDKRIVGNKLAALEDLVIARVVCGAMITERHKPAFVYVSRVEYGEVDDRISTLHVADDRGAVIHIDGGSAVAVAKSDIVHINPADTPVTKVARVGYGQSKT